MKLITLGLFAMLATVAATTASAGTVVLGTTTAGAVNDRPGSNFTGFTPINLNSANTYDWTFDFAPPLLGSTAVVNIQARDSDDTPELITFDLYNGVPGGLASFILTSSTGNRAEVAFVPTGGPWYIEVTPTYVLQGANNEQFSGTLLVSVPEPAAWALMLVGFGGLGVALRRRAPKAVTD